MKKMLLIVSVVLPVLSTIGLCVAVVGKAVADSCSGCGASNYLSWDANPGSADANIDGGFSLNQVLRWGFDEPRNQGTVIGIDLGLYNIGSVTYNPELFFPDEDCCTGVLTVQTAGTLAEKTEDGTLKSKAQIVYPYIASTKTVTIYSSY